MDFIFAASKGVDDRPSAPESLASEGMAAII